LRDTVRLAREHGVAVGAHPGFADLAGFGRREMRLSAREAEDLVLYQIAAVAGVAAAEGVRLKHVKAHGALYNMAARDSMLAGAIARATASIDRSLILYGLPNSELLKAARAAGLKAAAEGFADRAYEPDGALMSRRKPGALLVDPEIVIARALRLVKDHAVAACDGTPLTLHIDTLCLHGDTPGADQLAERLRRGLEQAGVTVKALSD
jgi:UPF0271 protein